MATDYADRSFVELERNLEALRRDLGEFPAIYFGHYTIARGADGFNHIADRVTLASPEVNRQEQAFYALLAEYAALGIEVARRRAATLEAPKQAQLEAAKPAEEDDLEAITF